MFRLRTRFSRADSCRLRFAFVAELADGARGTQARTGVANAAERRRCKKSSAPTAITATMSTRRTIAVVFTRCCWRCDFQRHAKNDSEFGALLRSSNLSDAHRETSGVWHRRPDNHRVRHWPQNAIRKSEFAARERVKRPTIFGG